MINKQIEDLVDLMFDTDMEEVMKEKSTLKYIHKLQQENKQLKEQLDVHKILLQTNAPSTCILTELEEWLKEQQERYRDYLSTRPKNDSEYNSKYATQCGLSQVDVILDKIQELKEKYK